MNITKETEKFISGRPSIKDCLKMGMINYSALSRKISAELGIAKKDAILIACRRFKDKLRKEEVQENKIRDIVARSKVEIKNKRIAVVLEKGIYHNDMIELEKEVRKKKETIQVNEGATAITIVTSEEFLESIKDKFKRDIMRINKGLIEINIKSPPEIETTPGVLPYLCSLFSDKGINIVENMSCWTDTLFLINENDFPKVMDSLNF